MPEPALYSSIFGDLVKKVQITFDEATKQEVALFSQSFYHGRFSWDTPSIEMTFEEIINKYNLVLAAAVISDDGDSPMRSSDGFKTLANKVCHLTHTYPMPMSDYRKIVALLDSKMANRNPNVRAMALKKMEELMFKGPKEAVEGVEAQVDNLILSALSNEGHLILDEKNNPEGIKLDLDYKMPNKNKFAAGKKAWIPENIEIIDIWEDFQQVLDEAEGTSVLKEALLSPDKINYILRARKIKQMIFGTDKSSKILSLNQFNEYMLENDFPILKKINRKMAIQKDGMRQPIRPWNPDNIVFIPEGELGVIKNAYDDEEIKPSPGVSNSYYNRIQVSQWSAGKADGKKSKEYTEASCMCLPVITAIEGCYSLDTQTVA